MTQQLGSRMRGPADGAGDWMRTREVMGVFHFRETLLDAVDERLVAGSKRADLDVGAPVGLNRHWNDRTIAAADLSGPPITPRRSFARFDDALGAEIVVGSLAGCIAAIAVAAMLAWQHAPESPALHSDYRPGDGLSTHCTDLSERTGVSVERPDLSCQPRRQR